MKKIKELISKILAIPLIINMLPTSVFASGIGNIEMDLNNKSERAVFIGTTGIADTTILPPLKIPPHAVNGELAYCMQGEKASPINTQMALNGNYDADSFIRGVIYYGYPNNATQLKEKHGVTDNQARGMTQFAIWYYNNPTYFAPKSHPYLDELRNLAKTQSAPATTLNLSTNNPKISINGNMQVSEVINTSSSYKGTFTFPSDANVYSTDINGNRKDTFNIGESFKIVSVGTVKGNITRNIYVTIIEPTLLRFVPINDSTIQELGKPDNKSTNTSKQISINFPGATGEIVVNKVSDIGEKLVGVEFGLYSDSATNNLISQKATDSQGRVVFDNLNIGTTYYIKELSSLNGYIMDSSIKTVSLNGTTENITVTNTKIMGQIRIIKSENGNPNNKLKGAEFNILDSGNNVVDTIVTTDNGEAISKLLPMGDYKVVESKAPIGYVLGNREIPVKITEHNKIYTFDYENDKIKGRIEILKLDTDGNKPLRNVKFGLYSAVDDRLIEELITNEDGRSVSSDLVYGSYYIKEIQPLDGYVVDNKKYHVDITENNKIYLVDVFNSKITGDLLITKIDAETRNPLANVEFKIVAKEGFDKDKIWHIVTDENGIGKLSGLKYGNYEIVETRTLTGYVLDATPVPFVIDKDGQLIEKTITNNKIKGGLELIKYDSITKKPLANVEFEIECIEGFNNGNKYTFVTDEDGRYTEDNLLYGKYRIIEIRAVEGYQLSSEHIEFEILEDGQIIKLEVENKPMLGSLIIHKLAEGTNKPLSGAEFGIYDEYDNLITIITTNEFGYAEIIELPYGNYYYMELKAPTGYLVDLDSYDFSIEYDGEVVEKTVYNRLLNPFPDGGDKVNKKEPLPDTSGVNITFVAIMVIIMGGSLILVDKKRKLKIN